MTTYTVTAEKSVATVTTLVASAGGNTVASVGQIIATFPDGSGVAFDSHEAFDAVFVEVVKPKAAEPKDEEPAEDKAPKAKKPSTPKAAKKK